MPQAAVAFGALLSFVGVVFYAATGGTSVTALIPTFVGVPMIVAGLLARNPQWRRHAMHAAALLGTLGLLGSAPGLVRLPALLAGGVARPAAVLEQAITAVLCLVFVVLCVRSFVNARRARAI